METNLIGCINCGHMVSINAERCPKCSVVDFEGCECVFCGDRGAKQELLEINSSYTRHKRFLHLYAHEACLEKICTHELDYSSITCEDCLTKISKDKMLEYLMSFYESGSPKQLSCSNCGSTRPLGNAMTPCYFCGGVIMTENYDKLRVKYKGAYYNKTYIKEVHCHKECAGNISSSFTVGDKEKESNFQKILDKFSPI